MSPIAGQTARPIGLKFFVDTHGCYRLKKSKTFQKKKFRGQRRALQLVLYIT